jgi:hypothetical protein
MAKASAFFRFEKKPYAMLICARWAVIRAATSAMLLLTVRVVEVAEGLGFLLVSGPLFFRHRGRRRPSWRMIKPLP